MVSPVQRPGSRAGRPAIDDDRRRFTRLVLGLGAAAALGRPRAAVAHGTRAGDLLIDHPYATPTPPGARTGAVYFRTLSNRGPQPDRLLSARTARCDAVEIHRSTLDGDVMRMRAIPALDLPPGAQLKLRHGGDAHLMLIGLKSPLEDGQRFALWLRFERAGEREVSVWVQTPRTHETHRH